MVRFPKGAFCSLMHDHDLRGEQAGDGAGAEGGLIQLLDHLPTRPA